MLRFLLDERFLPRSDGELEEKLLAFLFPTRCTDIDENQNTQNALSYLPNPSARAGYDTRSIFKWGLTGLNSEFSFSLTRCLTKAEEPSLSYYFPIEVPVV